MRGRGGIRSLRGASLANAAIGLLLLAAVVVAVIAVATRDPRGARGPGTGRRYAEGARGVASIDPQEIGWRESEEPMPIDMDSPKALALDREDRVCVIGDRLVIRAAGGEPVLRTEPFEEDYRALAVDRRGRVHAVASRRVDLLELDGARPETVRSVEIPGEGVSLTSIALTPEGAFLADAGGRRVLRLPVGLERAEERDPPFEILADGFVVPSVMDLAASPQGDLVTVDPGRHRVQLRDAYGDVVRAFGEMGFELADFHGCCNPAAIARMADGRTVTAEKGLGATRVKVYDEEGRLESVVAGPDRFDEPPDGPPLLLDVAVDSKGRILILDPGRKQVRVFTPEEGRGEDR